MPFSSLLRSSAATVKQRAFAREITILWCEAEHAGCTLPFQWVPHQCGIQGNERTDALALVTHTKSSEIVVDRYAKDHGIITEHPRLGHSDDRLSGGRLRPPLPSRRTRRAAPALLDSFRVNCGITKKALHRIGRADSRLCDIGGDENDISQVLRSCASYSKDREHFHSFAMLGVVFISRRYFVSGGAASRSEERVPGRTPFPGDSSFSVVTKFSYSCRKLFITSLSLPSLFPPLFFFLVSILDTHS